MVHQLAGEARQADRSLRTSQLTGYNYDSTFAVLLRMLIKDKPWLSWFVLAAIFGAVVSSLAAMLNSASTIATMDIFNRIFRDASQTTLVMAGRSFVLIFVIIAAIIAPALASPRFGGIFTFIQEFQGFISPGILTVFFFGLLVPSAPRFLGWMGIVLNVILYGLFKWHLGEWMTQNGLWFSNTMSFLDRMALCFIIIVLFCTILTLWKPLRTPVVLPVNQAMDIRPSKGAIRCGYGVIALTLMLYAIFW
jgi:SSS family solute:Na+ symporter